MGFGLALALVLAGGVFSYYTFNKQRQEGRWLEHTYEVITAAQRINRYIFEMESAEEAYRVTRNSRFLEIYKVNHEKIGPQIEDLKWNVRDNPDQRRKVSESEMYIKQLMNFWEELDNRYDSIYLFKHLIEITTEERKHLDLVHGSLQSMIDEERKLLVKRAHLNDEAVSRATAAQIVNTAFILAVAIILMVVCFRELRYRILAQQELKRKLKEELTLHEITNEQNWLLTGKAEINKALRGEHGMVALADKCLQTLRNYLELPAGAVYCYDDESLQLKLAAGAALPASVRQTYALYEGVIGQAAVQKEITVLRNVPSSYWKIESGSGMTVPGTIVCVPLWIDEEMIGVIELAAFDDIAKRKLDFLEKVTDAIATAFNAAMSRTKVLTLLDTVKKQKETLEGQQEELQQTNEELTRQSEILQASEEELRVQEEELRQINDEMNAQNTTLELARQELAMKAKELEQSSKYKSEFLANMSHELRTPLNSILILARLLEEDKEKNLTEKQVQYAGIIQKSGSDLLGLINDILDLSKIEAGKVELHIEDVPVKSMVQEMEQLFNMVADERQIRYVISVADNVPATVRTDKQRLSQVIRNLLSNAFKFTPKEGTVKLSWTVKAGELHIAVKDTGAGIPVEKQLLIFEAFRQADGSTNRKYGGTGLGLSISKELMLRLGGRIQLESEEGTGSTFTIVMPLEIPDHPVRTQETGGIEIIHEPEYSSEDIVEDDRAQLKAADKVILIIEDDANFATILRDFARQKGYKTIVALNGNDGLFFARKFLPMAIILDMNLPFIGGSSILKILKSSEDLKHILVHVVSAGEISLQVRDNILGFTQKPLHMSDLESVFTGISQQLQALFKKVLIISNGVLAQHPSLQSISDERRMQTAYDKVKSIEEAAAIVNKTTYDAIILDIGKDVEDGVQKLSQLREMMKVQDIPVIVYLDHDISETDELQLKKDAAAIVRNSTFSTDRLMDELELFLYKLKDAKKQAVETDRPSNNTDDLAGKKVLLVDDDMRNVFSLGALFADHGMEVISAADGREGLSRLDANPDANIVLMDIMMPEMDGYEAIRRIRANPVYADLPVIAITAKAMAGDREKCIAAGASDYIAKPIDNAKLLSLMRVWMK